MIFIKNSKAIIIKLTTTKLFSLSHCVKGFPCSLKFQNTRKLQLLMVIHLEAVLLRQYGYGMICGPFHLPHCLGAGWLSVADLSSRFVHSCSRHMESMQLKLSRNRSYNSMFQATNTVHMESICSEVSLRYCTILFTVKRRKWRRSGEIVWRENPREASVVVNRHSAHVLI